MSSLNDRQLKFLEKALHEREASIRSQVHTHIAHRNDDFYTELAGEVADEGDASVADLIIDFDHSMIELRVAELRAIDAARERISEGSYGECSDCGQSIDYKRLAVYPIAKRCIYCQAMYERTHSSGKRSTL